MQTNLLLASTFLVLCAEKRHVQDSCTYHSFFPQFTPAIQPGSALPFQDAFKAVLRLFMPPLSSEADTLQQCHYTPVVIAVAFSLCG